MSLSNMILSEEEIREIYEWVDEFDLTRIKRNIARDFSDAVLIAEILKEYYPQLVWMHCYSGVSSSMEKKQNWLLLKKRVMNKISFSLGMSEINSIINVEEHAVEKFLFRLKRFLEESAENIKEALKNNNKNNRGNIKDQLKRRKKGGDTFNSNSEKDKLLRQLQETIEILESKVGHLEMDVKSKDDKIFVMLKKLESSGIKV